MKYLGGQYSRKPQYLTPTIVVFLFCIKDLNHCNSMNIVLRYTSTCTFNLLMLLIVCLFFRFMTEAARREQETQKKKVQPKIAISVTGGVSRNSTATPPRHSNGSLTPPVTPPITPSSSFRSSTPTGYWSLWDFT